MKPVIALIGRPNVGKSTLFNALTRRRDALVADQPGLTRDRQYGEGRVGGRPYIVVDTGGIGTAPEVPDPEDLRAMAQAQTRQAMEEADTVLFLTDGRAGLTPADRDIAQELRRLTVPLVLVVNKTEGLDAEIVTAEFHALGLGAPVAIAAAHGQGVEGLMQRALAHLPANADAAPADEHRDQPRIAVVGRPNVGKSTLINALLGEERVIVFDQPGTTRDSIRIPFERDGQSYLLIDTAGVRRRARVQDPLEKFSVIKSLQAIDDANVAVLVLDARQEISEQDASLAGYILDQGRSLVLVVNKWDGLDASSREWIKREIDRKLPFLDFCRPYFISALEGTNLTALFPAIERAFVSARKTLSSIALNRVLGRAVEAVPPPMVRGRRVKLKYAHQGGKNPPRVVVHGNQVRSLPDAYRRYLSNTFRQAFKLEGTPVHIELRQGDNPFDKETRKPKRAPAKRRPLPRKRH